MAGGQGVETLVLLARDTPLADDVDLGRLLENFPAQKLPQLRRPDFDSGPISLGTIDDTKRTAQLKQRLGDHFTLIRSVSFANMGEAKVP